MSLDLSTVEQLSASLAEPAWLTERRRQAWELARATPMPDPQSEEWRRTDLRGLDLATIRGVESRNGGPSAELGDELAAMAVQSASGQTAIAIDPEVAASGVVLTSLSAAAASHPDLLQQYLFTAVRPDRDKFSALRAALFAGGLLVYVPAGVEVAKPIELRFHASRDQIAALPHLLVVAGPGASVGIVYELTSESGEGQLLAGGSAELFAEAGSRLDFVNIQRWGANAWQFADQALVARRDSTSRLINIGLGGRFAKTRVEAALQEPGANAELKALYFGSGDQFFDFHTLQDHQAPRTTSDLLFKGALRDTAHSLYAGLIRVEEGARRADAYQKNQNLLLSRTSKADSIPMLEILNNDVRCTHGATVGPVDPQHLFYLQMRGIPRPVAVRMIVEGFMAEVLDRIPVQKVRDQVAAELARKIEGVAGA